jgi:L-rhamnose-H+ transport protein
VNAVYCTILLLRRGNVARFGESAGANIGLVAVMAVLWSGSNFVYGAGARGMGALGFVLAWPIFMAAIVLTANVWGLLAGEWRSADRRALTWAASGCLLLIVGIWIIAWAGDRS